MVNFLSNYKQSGIDFCKMLSQYLAWRKLVMRYLIAVCALSVGIIAHAHSGGLAADGCHNDRKNGGRHCHGARARPPVERASGGSVYYPNCAAARAAGAAPIRAGQLGYGRHLDRDGDGKGCE